MLDLGWTEIMLIAGIAVLVISPKDLPRAMRTVGNWVGKMKRMASGFQRQFNDALREAELDDIKKDVEKLAKIDPMADVRKNVSEMDAALKKEMADTDKALRDATDVKSEVAEVTAGDTVKETTSAPVATAQTPSVANAEDVPAVKSEAKA